MDARTWIGWLRESMIDVKPYSGRGMYGKECVAAYPSEYGGAQSAIGLLCQEVENCFDMDEAKGIVSIMKHTEQDCMGLGIVLYWPRLEWPADVKRNDEDEATTE